jgi:hypothetical protein
MSATLEDYAARWRETNAPEDEAAYLCERVRLGDLSFDRLRLAAYVGGRPGPSLAVTAMGGETPKIGVVGVWVRELHAWGFEPPLRAGMAALRLLMERDIHPPLPLSWRKEQGRALRFVEDWVRCPCAEHMETVKGLVFEDRPLLVQVLETLDGLPPEEQATVGAREASRHAQSLVDDTLERLGNQVVRMGLGPPPEDLAGRGDYAKKAAPIRRQIELLVRSILAGALLPWALEISDPLDG